MKQSYVSFLAATEQELYLQKFYKFQLTEVSCIQWNLHVQDNNTFCSTFNL